jgi:hypothetical protein
MLPDTELVTRVVGGALAACGTMFITGVGAIAKMYADFKGLVSKQDSDMKSIQKQLEDCHQEKRDIYNKVTELCLKIDPRTVAQNDPRTGS